MSCAARRLNQCSVDLAAIESSTAYSSLDPAWPGGRPGTIGRIGINSANGKAARGRRPALTRGREGINTSVGPITVSSQAAASNNTTMSGRGKGGKGLGKGFQLQSQNNWFDKHLKAEKKQVNKKLKIYRLSKTEEDRKIYRIAKKNYEINIKFAKRAASPVICSSPSATTRS